MGLLWVSGLFVAESHGPVRGASEARRKIGGKAEGQGHVEWNGGGKRAFISTAVVRGAKAIVGSPCTVVEIRGVRY